MSFRPYTYARTQQFLLPLWAATSEVENKISDNSKYITTQESNKLTTENFAARLNQVDLVKKTTTDFDNKLTSFNKRIASNKTKYLEAQKKLNSLITKDHNFF